MWDKGDVAYFANRETGKAEKCRILEVKYGLPTLLTVQKEETGEIFTSGDIAFFRRKVDAVKDALTYGQRKIY